MDGQVLTNGQWLDSGDMSLEDVGSTTSLTAESIASDHCDGHSLSQGQEQDQESQCQGQDGIVLERIASLSLDMFDPSDFTGRFTKIQSRSRKRTRIIGGRCRQALEVFFFLLFFIGVNMSRWEQSCEESVICNRWVC